MLSSAGHQMQQVGTVLVAACGLLLQGQAAGVTPWRVASPDGRVIVQLQLAETGGQPTALL